MLKTRRIFNVKQQKLIKTTLKYFKNNKVAFTTWNAFLFGVFLVRIFPYLDWIRRNILYLSVISPNARKYGPEKLRIRTLFTQCFVNNRPNESRSSQIILTELARTWICRNSHKRFSIKTQNPRENICVIISFLIKF